ncbi:MAG: recombinase family protein [Halobacteriota archaeon]|jgi:DNA invertase Pin-like site-specific DNA recombinase/DNA-binding winged helix-turn-helix (wHTH) protein
MEAKPLVPAARYVRMSTEDQQYSIANQQAAIQTYANSHGFVVASTYADAGKSGVAIKDRKELRRLLSDVMSGRAQFKAILVYDVSRWGRFQDVDEAAHYEFLCRSAGIPVRYCAEQFENDGSAASAIMKTMKRTMAAEYSRELGIKVHAGQRRLALLGFRVVGTAGYGLRRMMVSPDGQRRLILKDGERKAIHTDRTILVPGPKKEVACIRTIFRLATAGKTPKEIAKELNVRRMLPSNGRPWGRSSVYRILTNEKYAGCNTYGKTTQKLSSVSRVVERHLWIRNPDAFVPIVGREIFDHVQKLLQKRGAPPEKSDAHLIQRMRKVLTREGKLTHRILKQKGILGCSYYKRFGSIMKAYEMAGYRPPPRTINLSGAQMRMRVLRKDLYIRLKQLFSARVRFIGLPGQQLRQVVEIDRRLRFAVYLCRAVDSEELGWILRLRPLDRHLPALICTVDQSFSKLLNFYVLPPLEKSLKWKILREGEPCLSAGRKLSKLEDSCAVANEVAFRSKNCACCTAVDDILMAADTWEITLGKKEISLGPVGSAIFNMLAQNAGQVVSRDRLRRATPDLIDPSNLDAHIYTLRTKLGVEDRKRIQTVRGAGYMYVSPDKSAECGSEAASQWHI